MLPTPCHIISDVHLGAAPPEVEPRLLRYLRSVPDSAASLVVNGDLFDFWFEWRHVIPRRGFRVLGELARLRELGIPLLWIAGNHDCWGSDFLRDEIGADYRVEPWEGFIGPWKTRIEHGDGLRPKADRAYRILRRVIRHPWSIGAFRWLHPDIGSAMASGSSQASRSFMPGDEGRELREIGLAQLESDEDLELLVFAHSHAPALERAPGGGIYANAGSWLDRPACLVVDDLRVRLASLDSEGRLSAEDDLLHVLDRRAEKATPDSKHLLRGVRSDESVGGG